jgi:hypothetical protein
MAQTPLIASNLNLPSLGDGIGASSTIGFRVYYTGAAWAFSTTEGHTTQASANLSAAWNTNLLEIDVSTITKPFIADPAMVATPKVGSIFRPTCTGDTATCIIQWLDKDDNIETTESVEMDCYVILTGYITGHFSDT